MLDSSQEAISEMAIKNKEQMIGIAQETIKGLFSDFTGEQTHTFVEMLTQLSSTSITKQSKKLFPT